MSAPDKNFRTALMHDLPTNITPEHLQGTVEYH
jgi:hypothetical protein